MPNFLQIDNKQVRDYTNTLRQMHRSDLPIVIRQTLNDTAFDVKKNTLMPAIDRKFILRNPSFFKKFSGVKMADGWNVNSMRSEVGIIKSSQRGGEVAAELTQQEFGGKIKHKARLLKFVRRGKTRLGKVNSSYNLTKKGYVEGAPKYNRGRKSNFVAEAFVAFKENKYMNIRTKKGKDTLLLVESISQNVKTRKFNIRLKGIAELNQENKQLKARPFMKPAGEKSYLKQESFYIRNARKRLNKYL